MIEYLMFRRGGDTVGFFAISKCGHDAGECYVIVDAETSVQNSVQGKGQGQIFVANGLNRTIQKPKRKNPSHLFITKRSVPEIEKLLKGEPVSSNLKLAAAIKTFNQERLSENPTEVK